MGLDVVIYKNDSKTVLEIKEIVHKTIFNGRFDLSNLIQIPKLQDYYKTNVLLEISDMKNLVEELKSISKQMDYFNKTEINKIIDELSASEIIKIHIAGD